MQLQTATCVELGMKKGPFCNPSDVSLETAPYLWSALYRWKKIPRFLYPLYFPQFMIKYSVSFGFGVPCRSESPLAIWHKMLFYELLTILVQSHWISRFSRCVDLIQIYYVLPGRHGAQIGPVYLSGIVVVCPYHPHPAVPSLVSLAMTLVSLLCVVLSERRGFYLWAHNRWGYKHQ